MQALLGITSKARCMRIYALVMNAPFKAWRVSEQQVRNLLASNDFQLGKDFFLFVDTGHKGVTVGAIARPLPEAYRKKLGIENPWGEMPTCLKADPVSPAYFFRCQGDYPVPLVVLIESSGEGFTEDDMEQLPVRGEGKVGVWQISERTFKTLVRNSRDAPWRHYEFFRRANEGEEGERLSPESLRTLEPASTRFVAPWSHLVT